MIDPKLPRDIRQIRMASPIDARDFPSGVVAIEEVYVTDLSTAHHYCSPERLAWLLGLRFEFTLADGLSQARQEELSCEEGSSGPDDTYMSMARVEALEFVSFEDDPSDSDEEAMDAAREFFQGNWQ